MTTSARLMAMAQLSQVTMNIEQKNNKARKQLVRETTNLLAKK